MSAIGELPVPGSLGIKDRLHRLRLSAERCRVQLGYIDGDHRFESVMFDFTLVARLCDIGAVIVFDDLWMPSIRCVLRYIEANRKDWRRIPSPHRNVCMLERIAKDERTWNHFVRF